MAEAADDAELLILATPVAGLRTTCTALAALRPRQVVSVCKGLELDSGLLPHQVIAEALPGVHAAALSGPSFASEVAAGLPVALTAASVDEVLAERIVHTLHGGAVRVYRSCRRRGRRGGRCGQERDGARGRYLGWSGARRQRAGRAADPGSSRK